MGFNKFHIYFSVNRYSVRIQVYNPLLATSYIRWQLNADNLPDDTQNIDQLVSKKDIAIPARETINHVITIQIPSEIINQELLRNTIIFKSFHGPWKTPVKINNNDRQITDLHLTDNKNDLPVFMITLSKTGR